MKKALLFMITFFLVVPLSACSSTEVSDESRPLDEVDTHLVVRNEKNGFDSTTNSIYKFANYTVEIPEYWKSESDISGGIQRYAEAGSKVAMLQVVAEQESDDSYPVTFEGLMADNDNMIVMLERTAFEEVTDYEVIDTGAVKGILYKGTIDEDKVGQSGYSEWFAFASEEDRNWCTLILCQTDNTEYLYTEDFYKMIMSIRKREIEPETDSETTIESEISLEPETSNEPENSADSEIEKSDYEKAFVRDMSNYDLYYMFDIDTKSVVYFGTNDTYIEKGTYSGDFSTGVTITWSHGEWTEKFTHTNGEYATLVDGNGWDWEYKICDVEQAQIILDNVQ